MVIAFEGVVVGLIVTAIEFEVAGDPTTPLAFEVMIHVTTAPLVKVDDVKVGLFVPAFTPFTCH